MATDEPQEALAAVENGEDDALYMTAWPMGHEVRSYLESNEDGSQGFNNWRYVNNGELRIQGGLERNCIKCGLLPTPQGHDPCIANLPGVASACCGHGVAEKSAYVLFENGVIFRGQVDFKS